MTDAARRRVRTILLLAFIPFALAGIVLAVKLVSLSTIAGSAIDAYDRGNFESSVERTDGLHGWNFFEPWVAFFDRGTANAGAGSYNEAIDDLERAFEGAPAEKRCDVAVNLSLSWELLGDSYTGQGLFAGAERLYDTARSVIDAAGPECEPGAAPTNSEENRNAGDELAEARERLDGKAGVAREFEAQERSDAAPGGPQQQLDQLERNGQDAAQEKAEQQGQERGNTGGGAFTDRPW